MLVDMVMACSFAKSADLLFAPYSMARSFKLRWPVQMETQRLKLDSTYMSVQKQTGRLSLKVLFSFKKGLSKMLNKTINLTALRCASGGKLWRR